MNLSKNAKSLFQDKCLVDISKMGSFKTLIRLFTPCIFHIFKNMLLNKILKLFVLKFWILDFKKGVKIRLRHILKSSQEDANYA